MEFVRKIQNGFRMNKPDFSPNEFGKIMESCWQIDPHKRPTFHQLEIEIGKHMQSVLCTYYTDLNSPFEELNQEIAKSSSKDRLADLGLAKLLNSDGNMGKTQLHKSISLRVHHNANQTTGVTRTKSLSTTGVRR